MILHMSGRQPPSEEEVDDLFMLLLDDDLEDSPWMVMGSLQYDAAGDLYQSLRNYARRHQRPWLVMSMLPILYRVSESSRKRQLSPDLYVAFVPDRPRSSFDVEVEGGFPPFVMEVVSPSSADRDLTEKRGAYRRLGAREYALFNPLVDEPSELFGYRRSAAGTFEPWPADDQGRLWSDVLGLYLVAEGVTIRATTREGEILRTPVESEIAIDRLEREIEDLRRQAKGK